MKTVKTLIEMAREKAQDNEAQLARTLGVPPHHPHEWRTGKRALTAESAAMICDYLGLSGEESREWVAVAIIENPKNAGRVELLKRALFACWVLGVGILLTLPNGANARTGEPINPGYQNSTVYTLSRFAAWLRRALDRALAPQRQPPADAREGQRNLSIGHVV